MTSYLYASKTQVGLAAFHRQRMSLSGTWMVVTEPSDLSIAVERLRPRYCFFPHWSEIVPDSVLSLTECVCFHMTDLPYGRGGSPLQNLIVRGHDETMITALKMTKEIDSGPIYLKRPLSLEGSAEEIFARAADIILDMIKEIVRTEPNPFAQCGAPFMFNRRTPDQSALPETDDLETIFNHIRMLDAPGYPNAFLRRAGIKMTFVEAIRTAKGLTARVNFERDGDD